MLSDERPIVLCAVDWVGISGKGHEAWRKALADAARTSPDRVAVHCLHQHDAPGFDPAAEEVDGGAEAAGRGISSRLRRGAFSPAPQGRSNTRWPSRRSSLIWVWERPRSKTLPRIAACSVRMERCGTFAGVRRGTRTPVQPPEGIIDPAVRVISLWNGEQPVAVLSYYATHPQSHYGKGGVSCDFVGIARRLRDRAQPGVFFVHFNGAVGKRHRRQVQRRLTRKPPGSGAAAGRRNGRRAG